MMHGLLGFTTFENDRNVTLRHCKIGKVRDKREVGYLWPSAPLPKKSDTFFIDPYPWVSHPIIGRYA